jgi:hypothetical protein
MADQAESKKLESYIPRVPQIYKEGEKASAAAISNPHLLKGNTSAASA